MDNHPIGELMETTMRKIREMVDVNTIIGQPIQTGEGMTLIPISKVSFGFASGGSDIQGKQQGQDKGFGGGSGAGVKIQPVAFVVVNGENVRIMSVSPSDTPVDKLVDAVPDMIDKITGMFKKDEE
jgi:sporulation protein YtfJ